jgi:anti-anti-sigma factor
VTGEIDLGTADVFREQVRAVALTGRHVVLDMGGVTFMDSSGLAVLVEATSDAGSLTLREPTAIVRRVLEATGLTPLFRVDP